MGAKYCLVLRPSVKLRFWRGFFEGILLVNLDIKTYLLGRSHSSCSLDSPVSTALCFFPPDSIRKRELLRFLLYFKYKKNCMCALLSLGAGAAAGCRCCVCLGLGPGAAALCAWELGCWCCCREPLLCALESLWVLVPLQGAAAVCAWELGSWCCCSVPFYTCKCMLWSMGGGAAVKWLDGTRRRSP